MKITELLEARSNPQLNRKVDTLDQLTKIFDANYGTTLYVSFTSINKLGINPNSKYKTPNGIYAYPLTYVLDDYNNIPFASGSNYAQVFSSSGNIMEINNLDSIRAERLKEKIDLLCDLADDPKAQAQFEKYYEDNRHIGSAIWYYVYYAAKKTADHSAPERYNDQGDRVRWPTALAAANLWRKLGYDGVVDYNTSTIHENEPTQAVFFSKDTVHHIATINNNIDDTDEIRQRTRDAANTWSNIIDWQYVEDKIESEQLIRRLPKPVEDRMFQTKPTANREIWAMMTYITRMMKQVRVPANVEAWISENKTAAEDYTRLHKNNPKVAAAVGIDLKNLSNSSNSDDF